MKPEDPRCAKSIQFLGKFGSFLNIAGSRRSPPFKVQSPCPYYWSAVAVSAHPDGMTILVSSFIAHVIVYAGAIVTAWPRCHGSAAAPSCNLYGIHTVCHTADCSHDPFPDLWHVPYAKRSKSVALSESLRCMGVSFNILQFHVDKAGEPQPTAQGRGLRLGSQPPGRQISRSERHGNTMDCFHLLWQEQCGSTSEKTTFSGPA